MFVDVISGEVVALEDLSSSPWYSESCATRVRVGMGIIDLLALAGLLACCLFVVGDFDLAYDCCADWCFNLKLIFFTL